MISCDALTTSAHPYDRLTPDVIIAAVESCGGLSDRRILALNSYENRVYQVGMETGAPLIAKFYRPGCWSEAAILEEHDFALELAQAEIPVVPPLLREGRSLFEYQGFRFALFERRGGRWPELDTQAQRAWMGRFLGRIHAVGRRRAFQQREWLDIERLGGASRDFLLESGWIPAHLQTAYDTLTADLLEVITATFEQTEPGSLRLHGDCHRGNVLWTDAGPHFVDLDDCLMGPAIQDLWMLLSGSRAEMAQQLSDLLEGYTQFAPFDYRETGLIESLRTLRMIHYSAWLARRWSDPAFPAAFPWFIEPRYWEEQVLALREQLGALAEGPLEL
ncbi:serine/threonine protein kinase [Steroidobacter denitrificans]|uniref:Stress response kinase A n=1 Tax=Steroidobacter denitrificans TaxID=465721 RepID=A0A127FAH8_STEDE|nr:serine/threonine protein kinase [Steroidobacter denitrificans]AMN47427.1 serine/threonine protein kinase [Steroidobacter denitrificans]